MNRLLALVLLSVLAAPLPALAQKMYKCGKQYQDRPCDAGTATPPPAPATPVSEPATPAGPSAAAEKSRAIRCENWNRQIENVRQKEKGEKNPQAIKVLADQRQNLEGRAKGDGC